MAVPIPVSRVQEWWGSLELTVGLAGRGGLKGHCQAHSRLVEHAREPRGQVRLAVHAPTELVGLESEGQPAPTNS